MHLFNNEPLSILDHASDDEAENGLILAEQMADVLVGGPANGAVMVALSILIGKTIAHAPTHMRAEVLSEIEKMSLIYADSIKYEELT